MHVNYNSKPSKTTIIACIKKALNTGTRHIYIQWGENMIEIEKTQFGLMGSGWIGKNSGQDIAQLFKMHN